VRGLIAARAGQKWKGVCGVSTACRSEDVAAGVRALQPRQGLQRQRQQQHEADALLHDLVLAWVSRWEVAVMLRRGGHVVMGACQVARCRGGYVVTRATGWRLGLHAAGGIMLHCLASRFP
jgi:hypothetical protein